MVIVSPQTQGPQLLLNPQSVQELSCLRGVSKKHQSQIQQPSQAQISPESWAGWTSGSLCSRKNPGYLKQRSGAQHVWSLDCDQATSSPSLSYLSGNCWGRWGERLTRTDIGYQHCSLDFKFGEIWRVFSFFVVGFLLCFVDLVAWLVGSLCPDQVSNLCPFQWSMDLNHWTAGKLPGFQVLIPFQTRQPRPRLLPPHIWIGIHRVLPDTPLQLCLRFMSVLRAVPRGHHPPPQETAPSSTLLSHPGVGEAGFFSSTHLLSNSYTDRSNTKNITSFSENTLIKKSISLLWERHQGWDSSPQNGPLTKMMKNRPVQSQQMKTTAPANNFLFISIKATQIYSPGLGNSLALYLQRPKLWVCLSVIWKTNKEPIAELQVFTGEWRSISGFYHWWAQAQDNPDSNHNPNVGKYTLGTSFTTFSGSFSISKLTFFSFLFSEICTIVLGIFAPTVEMWFGLFFFSSNFQIATITKIHTSTRLLFWQNNVIIPVDSVPEKSLLWNGLTPTLLTLWLISLEGSLKTPRLRFWG